MRRKSRSRAWTVGAAACVVLLFGWFALRGQAPSTARRSEVERRAAAATRAAFHVARAAAPSVAALSGRIGATDGSAVGGALVCAACAGCDAIGAKPSPCVRSGGDGLYVFATLPEGTYYVQASADGFAPGTAQGGRALSITAPSARDGVDIVLARGGAQLQGVVHDATGGTVAHARVRAVRLSPPQFSFDTESDEAGRFALAVGEGALLLTAEAEDYAPYRGNHVAPSRDANLVLTPAGRVRGVVVAAADGAPLPGIEVRALPSRARNAPLFASAVSDERGQFALEGLEPGSFALSARGGRWFGELPQSIDLGLGEQRSDIVIEVAAAAEVQGRVLGERGEPCEQGFVGLRARAAGLPDGRDAQAQRAYLGIEQVAHIQPDGSVRFEGVQAGDYGVTVRCIGRLLRAGPRTLVVGADSIAGLTWTVADATTLAVRIVDDRKQPRPFVPFVLRKPDLDGRGRAITVYNTDALGRFEVPGLPAGEYTVEPGRGYRGEPVTVALREGVVRADATLVLGGSGTVEVEVVAASGTSIDRVRVSALEVQPALVIDAKPAKPIQAVALGLGRFRIGPLPAGTYVVTADDGINPPVRAPGGGSVEVHHGTTTRVALRLPPAVALSGRVSDASGAPAANVWVSATRVLDDAASPRLPPFEGSGIGRVLTDEEGRFELDGLVQSARYTVRVSEPYGSAAVVRDAMPGAPLAVVLPAAGAIGGVVLDRDGRPARQFLLHARTLETESVQERTIADPNGRFALAEVPPGTVQLTLITPYGETAQSEIQLAPGARNEQLRIVVQSAEELAASESAPAAAPNRL